LIRYFSDWRAYNSLAGGRALKWKESFPQIFDRSTHTPFDAHYFFQACWLARKLAASGPIVHVDVGSSVSMIAILSGFVSTVFVDLRPLRAKVSGLIGLAGDLLCLPFADASIKSLSSLHVLEHVGLGRYGDALDPSGSGRTAAELVRVLAPGGRLFLSTPTGRERVEFNAHRVFAPATVLGMFESLELLSFSFVDDAGSFHPVGSPNDVAKAEYACGMFEFRRPIT
jgi:SAM-dependent methyltransferase